MGARGLMCFRTITAGGEFRPALRTLKPRDKLSRLLIQVGSAYWLRHITNWLSPIMKEIAADTVTMLRDASVRSMTRIIVRAPQTTTTRLAREWWRHA